MREASIGQSVSATSAESSTEIARVKPNSGKSAPVWPGRNDSGTKTAASVSVVAMTAKNTWRGADHRGGARPKPSAAPAHDVLQHDDGVVHHQAGREHQRQQGQDVDREADEVDRRERADQRHRDGHRRDQRGAPVAQEDDR